MDALVPFSAPLADFEMFSRLSSIARKHKSLMTAKTIINALYGYNAMEVQEAFIKIKEQARCSMADPELKVATLNLLNTQNMEYFHANHQAELFRLKAVTLQVGSSLDPSG